MSYPSKIDSSLSPNGNYGYLNQGEEVEMDEETRALFDLMQTTLLSRIRTGPEDAKQAMAEMMGKSGLLQKALKTGDIPPKVAESIPKISETYNKFLHKFIGKYDSISDNKNMFHGLDGDALFSANFYTSNALELAAGLEEGEELTRHLLQTMNENQIAETLEHMVKRHKIPAFSDISEPPLGKTLGAMERIFELGISPNAKTPTDTSLLYSAMQTKKGPIVDLLIKNGAKLDFREQAGLAIDFAYKVLPGELLQKLLDANVLDLSTKDASGKSFFEHLYPDS